VQCLFRHERLASDDQLRDRSPQHHAPSNRWPQDQQVSKFPGFISPQAAQDFSSSTS
jgi:hypothetical protein